MEIDRLQRKARDRKALDPREALWLVERVNQLRDALAQMQTAQTIRHGAVVALAVRSAERAQLDATVSEGAADSLVRGNEWWTELYLNQSPAAWPGPGPLSEAGASQ